MKFLLGSGDFLGEGADVEGLGAGHGEGEPWVSSRHLEDREGQGVPGMPPVGLPFAPRFRRQFHRRAVAGEFGEEAADDAIGDLLSRSASHAAEEELPRLGHRPQDSGDPKRTKMPERDSPHLGGRFSIAAENTDRHDRRSTPSDLRMEEAHDGISSLPGGRESSEVDRAEAVRKDPKSVQCGNPRKPR